MSIAYLTSTGFPAGIMLDKTFAVVRLRLVAFGFLGMGPVTIAVDSYGPVTDNAQSVYELSVIEGIPGIKEEVKRDFGFDLSFDKASIPSRRTTAPATPSRRRPSPFSSARPSWAPPR